MVATKVGASERHSVSASLVVIHLGAHRDGLGLTEGRIGLHGVPESGFSEGVVVRELRESLDKLHFDGVQCAVPVLGQNQLPKPIGVDAVWMLRDAVVLRPVDEGHDVGVLLNRSRFPLSPLAGQAMVPATRPSKEI